MTALSPPKHPPPAWLGTQHRSTIGQASRYHGALLVLVTRGAHIEQCSADNYSTAPTIGTVCEGHPFAGSRCAVTTNSTGSGLRAA
jgi:hypothetical protein